VNAYQACRDGDCNSYSCPVCAHHCAACDELHGDCICPQLPIDTEDQP